MDAFTPTGNSTTKGVIGTTGLADTATTFNALDSIKATGTGNTLSIIDQATTSVTFPTVTVSGVQTANIQSVSGVTVDTSGWTGLTALNVTASTGADVITAASTAATAVTDTLAKAAAAATSLNTTVDGGTTATVTATGTNATGSAVLGNITVGGTTAPTGSVNVTATETAAVAGTLGNVAATGGADVTVTSTENFAILASSTAGTVSATGGTGAVSVTSTTNVTETDNPITANGAITAGAISATGGTTITVNEAATASTAALAAELGAGHTLTVTQGAVTVLDGGTATSVTVNQTAPATAAAGTAATTATASSTTAGGPGYSAVTTAGTAAAALVPATLGVVDGAVTVSGASTGDALANASSTITSVSLNNFASAKINSSALTTLTLAGKGGGLVIDNVGNTKFTTLALNVNKATPGTITESTDGSGGTTTAGKVTTLNVTTGGSGTSTINSLSNFTALTTLTVAGTQTLAFTTTPQTLTTVNVSGAAGLTADISTGYLTAAAPAVTTTSSGTMTLTMDIDSTHQETFVGSTGQDIITIASDATKAITGGSATNNEIVLNAAASTFQTGTGHTWADVTGFSTLGLNTGSSGAYNLGAMGTNVFNAIDVKGTLGVAATASFTSVAHNASLSIDASENAGATGVLNYQAADATGASDVVTVNLGTSSGGSITVGVAGDDGSTVAKSSLTMQDANGVGIGTLTIVSNDTSTGAAAGNVNTIVALADSGLSNLNVSGVDGLTINILNEGITSGATATAATSFTINNTSGGTVTIGTFTDSALGSLTFTGSGNDAITTLYNGTTSHALSISNTGTGTATITTLSGNATPTADALTSLTLGSGVALGPDASALTNYTTKGLQDAATTGVTVSGSADNAHVVLNLTSGAAAGSTDTITLGNGNDYINDASTAGTVKVTVGTGQNDIILGNASATTYSAAVVLGTHAAADSIAVGTVYGSGAAGAGAILPSTVITGEAKGDLLVIADATAVATALTATQLTTVSGLSSLSAAITAVDGTGATGTALAANTAIAFQYGGNTYVLETHATGTGTLTAADTLIELVGIHTLGTISTHTITMAS